MIKDYKVYRVRLSDKTCKYIGAFNPEHALFIAELWICTEYPKDSEPDVVSISLEINIESLLIYKSE